MNKKTYLEAPQAELLSVRFEENILSDPWRTSTVQEQNEDDDDLLF